MSEFLTERDQEAFTVIADVLIPGALHMPSASQAEVPTRWADQVLNVRQDLREPFFRALRKLIGKPPQEAMTSLQRDDVEAFNALGTVAAGAYFLNPEVRKCIGYPGQESRSSYPAEDVPDYVVEGLLEPVLKRGEIYRKI